MNWRKFLVLALIICALTTAIIFLFSRERHFDWDKRYLSKSDEPYGLKLFDKLMKESMPKGYEATFYPDKEKSNYNLLLINENIKLNRRNATAIYEHLDAGNDVMIITELLDAFEINKPEHDDTLDILNKAGIQHNESDSTKVNRIIGESMQHAKTITSLIDILKGHIYLEDEENTPQDIKNSPKVLLTQPLTRSKDTKTVTARKAFCTAYIDEALFNQQGAGKWTLYNKTPKIAYDMSRGRIMAAYAAHTKVGKGNLYVISAALCFTNAGILDDMTLPFVVSTMDMIADKPVVRIVKPHLLGKDASDDTEEEEEKESVSIFHFFHKHKALNLMLYITLVGILLAIFFNARRRQRAINVRKTERNTTLAFIRQIASLYKADTDYRQLYVNKLYAFAELVRKKVGADIFNCTENDIQAIAHRTNLSHDEIKKQIALLMDYNQTDGLKRMTFEDFTTAANIIRNIKKKIVESR